MWKFASIPNSEHYRNLGEQLLLAESPQMHPALWQRRDTVAESLFKMAAAPQSERNVSTYHALSLLVW
jgi:hypothetical protein